MHGVSGCALVRGYLDPLAPRHARCRRCISDMLGYLQPSAPSGLKEPTKWSLTRRLQVGTSGSIVWVPTVPLTPTSRWRSSTSGRRGAMGNYDLTAIFTKEPVVIAGAVRSVLFVAVLMGAVILDEKQIAGIALGLEVLLGLFVRSQSTPKVDPTLTVGTSVNQGSAVVASVVPPPEPTVKVP